MAIRKNGRVIKNVNAEYQNLKLALYVTSSHNVHIPNTKGHVKMNALKNMEAVFVAAVVIAGFTTFATANDSRTAPASAPTPAAQVSTGQNVATVVVSTKRLTHEEKMRLGS